MERGTEEDWRSLDGKKTEKSVGGGGGGSIKMGEKLGRDRKMLEVGGYVGRNG